MGLQPQRFSHHEYTYSERLTATSHTSTTNPSSEKYAMNAGRLNSRSRSSSECVGSLTMPKTAISTAPPAMSSVPSSIQGENTSPRRRRAKKAFHRRETAPRGARMTTGRDAIWNTDPKRLEEMKMAGKRQRRPHRT